MELLSSNKRLILDDDEEEVEMPSHPIVPELKKEDNHNDLPLKEKDVNAKIESSNKKEITELRKESMSSTRMPELQSISHKEEVLIPFVKKENKVDLASKIKNQLNSIKNNSVIVNNNNINRNSNIKSHNNNGFSKTNANGMSTMSKTMPPTNMLNRKREKKIETESEDSSSSFSSSEEYYDTTKADKVLNECLPSKKLNNLSPKKKVDVISRPVKPVIKKTTRPDSSYNKSSTKMEKTQNIKNKEGLVLELLKRWWYVIDTEWYKTKEDIKTILDSNNLRLIDISDWKTQDDVVNGKTKCIELKAFPYIFLDCNDKYHDFRNKENIPSFNNLMKKVSLLFNSY